MGSTTNWQVTVDLDVHVPSDTVDELAGALERYEVLDAGIGFLPDRLSVTATVAEDVPGYAAERVIHALTDLLDAPGARVLAVEVLSEDEADRRLEQPAFPELAGVAEVAEILGVTKQRASTLQSRSGFPAPVAHLRTGPVWRAADLARFAESWERKPGRPRKAVKHFEG
jgi:hypothetical protein